MHGKTVDLPSIQGMIVRKGKIFECGEFPDKGFSMSPEELRTAVEKFSEPVPIDLDHTPTVLDGKLGHVQGLSISENGLDLMGVVHLPDWLDKLLVDGERKVSATWDRSTKTLQKLALVRTPRVSDASLFAAFSAGRPKEAAAAFAKDRTMRGQMMLQGVHDRCAEAGAVCKDDPSFASAVFHSAPELSSIQAAHDAACNGGASCRMFSKEDMDKRGVMFAGLAKFTPRKQMEHATKTHQILHDVISAGYPGACTGGMMRSNPSDGDNDADDDISASGDSDHDSASMADTPKQLKSLKAVHDMTVEHGATCPGKSKIKMSGGRAGSPNLARFAMKEFEPFLAAFGNLPDVPTKEDIAGLLRQAPRDLIDTIAKEAPPDPLAAFADNPVIRKLIDDNKARDMRDAARDKAEAVKVATDFVKPHAARLLLPDAVTVAFASFMYQLGEIDKKAETPMVAFSIDDKPQAVSLTDVVNTLFARLPDSPQARQLIINEGELPAEFSVKGLRGTDASKPTQEQLDREALALNEAGRKVLAERDQQRKGA